MSDLLYTADDDLLCSVDPVFPDNNRTLALNQDQNIAQKMVYFHLYFSIPCAQNNLCLKV